MTYETISTNTYICDRCGDREPGITHKFRPDTAPAKWERITYTDQTELGGIEQGADLCATCAVDFRLWLKGAPK